MNESPAQIPQPHNSIAAQRFIQLARMMVTMARRAAITGESLAEMCRDNVSTESESDNEPL